MNRFRVILACLASAALGLWSSTLGPQAIIPTTRVSTNALNKYETAQRQTVLVRTPQSQGSAVMLQRTNSLGQSRWFAWTAAHVVDTNHAVQIYVQLYNEHRRAGAMLFDAKVLARNDYYDIALLWVDARSDAFLSARFAPDTPAKIGDDIFACGNFRGIEFVGSISTGVISQVGAQPGGDWPWPLCDQTTVPVYPGSSGGGVFNAAGEVLGLVVGGYGATLNVFVPVRAISQFAAVNGFMWAVRDNYCPSNAALNINR